MTLHMLNMYYIVLHGERKHFLVKSHCFHSHSDQWVVSILIKSIYCHINSPSSSQGDTHFLWVISWFCPEDSVISFPDFPPKSFTHLIRVCNVYPSNHTALSCFMLEETQIFTKINEDQFDQDLFDMKKYKKQF